MKKIIVSILLIFLLMLLLVQLACATGIAAYNPPHKITYIPFSEPAFEFAIVGSSTDVEVYVSGYLSEYATISRKTITAEDTDRMFTVRFKFPDDTVFITPGHHRVGVGFREIVGAAGTVGTALAGSTFIEVDVFHPGKYVESSFTANDVNSNETSSFFFIANSFGRKNISSIHGVIDTYDLDGNKIETILTQNYALKSGEKLELYGRRLMDKHKPGNYVAKAKLYWDENVTYFEDPFRVGKLRVDILNYTKVLTPGTINRFDMLLKSMWNNEIKDLYSEVFLMHDNNSVITSFMTPLTGISPWTEKNLTVFWEVPDLALKTYKLKIKLYYDGDSSTELGEITAVKAEKPFRINYVYVIIGLLVVIILVLVVDIVWIMNKKKG